MQTVERYIEDQNNQPLRDKVMAGKQSCVFPATDNPVLAHLLEMANHYLEKDGVEAAFTWLAVHAWREGGLDFASNPIKA